MVFVANAVSRLPLESVNLLGAGVWSFGADDDPHPVGPSYS